MSKPHPVEFRRDVVAVARKREAQLRRIAKDFGISSTCFPKRLKRAEVEEGVAPGVMEKDAPALWEAKKWIRLLEPETKVLRRALVDLS